MRQVPVWCNEHSLSPASQALTGNKWRKCEYWVRHLIMSCINSWLYHKSTSVSLMSVINRLYGHQKQRTNTFYVIIPRGFVQCCTGLTCLYIKTGRCKCKCLLSDVQWSREEGDIQESTLGCESISFGLRRSGTTSRYTTRDLRLLPPVILLLHLHTIPPSPGGGFTIRHAGWKVMETQFVLSDGKGGVDEWLLTNRGGSDDSFISN